MESSHFIPVQLHGGILESNQFPMIFLLWERELLRNNNDLRSLGHNESAKDDWRKQNVMIMVK